MRVPWEVTTMPLTCTRPAEINSSAWRREAMPLWAKKRARRSPSPCSCVIACSILALHSFCCCFISRSRPLARYSYFSLSFHGLGIIYIYYLLDAKLLTSLWYVVCFRRNTIVRACWFFTRMPIIPEALTSSYSVLHVGRKTLMACIRGLHFKTPAWLNKFTNILFTLFMMFISVIFVIGLTHSVTISTLLLCSLLLLADLLYYVRMQHPLVYYSLMIRLFPRWASAYYKRANVYWNRKEFQRALADYEKVIQRRPHDAEMYADRGLIYYEMRAYRQCLSDCE